jgi:hypothetical protein
MMTSTPSSHTAWRALFAVPARALARDARLRDDVIIERPDLVRTRAINPAPGPASDCAAASGARGTVSIADLRSVSRAGTSSASLDNARRLRRRRPCRLRARKLRIREVGGAEIHRQILVAPGHQVTALAGFGIQQARLQRGDRAPGIRETIGASRGIEIFASAREREPRGEREHRAATEERAEQSVLDGETSHCDFRFPGTAKTKTMKSSNHSASLREIAIFAIFQCFPPETLAPRFMQARTLYDKLWSDHVVREESDGTTLLYIDRHLVHEVTSPQAFEGLKLAGRKPWRADSIVATADHNTPTKDWALGIRDPISRTQVETLDANIKATGAKAYFPFLDRRQGIVHVIGPENGATLPA